ncbi:MAG: hypothetical protein J3K34DRAFT_461561 [Monoraphidium minutum]|nr:MAG: hypothetical protein J3K34DRAFT_461561 [Monoraphidium minutum]
MLSSGHPMTGRAADARRCRGSAGGALAAPGAFSAPMLWPVGGRASGFPAAPRPTRRPQLAAAAAAKGKPGQKGTAKKGAAAAAPPPPGHAPHAVAAAAASVSLSVSTEDLLSAAPGDAAALGAAFAGGALGGGEIDVAVADSDEELDCAARAGPIVPAGVLGAAGLAGVSGEGAPRSSQSHHRCLVLDAAYRPINTISWFRAVMMDVGGKVDVLDYHEGAYAYSAHAAHELPAVVRARASVNMHDIAGRVALTRRNILSRDKHACQYCGSRSNLTLDHVLPVCRGGRNTWENLVTCCMHCNQRKGGSLLRDLGWRLKVPPREPTSRDLGVVLGVSQADLDNPPKQWGPWLEPYRPRKKEAAAAAAAAVAAAAGAPACTGSAAVAPAARLLPHCMILERGPFPSMAGRAAHLYQFARD